MTTPWGGIFPCYRGPRNCVYGTINATQPALVSRGHEWHGEFLAHITKLILQSQPAAARSYWSCHSQQNPTSTDLGQDILENFFITNTASNEPWTYTKTETLNTFWLKFGPNFWDFGVQGGDLLVRVLSAPGNHDMHHWLVQRQRVALMTEFTDKTLHIDLPIWCDFTGGKSIAQHF